MGEVLYITVSFYPYSPGECGGLHFSDGYYSIFHLHMVFFTMGTDTPSYRRMRLMFYPKLWTFVTAPTYRVQQKGYYDIQSEVVQ